MSDDDSSFGSSSSEEEGVYTVQSIVSKRGGRGGKKVEYLVRWKGYGSDDDTWEPIDSLAESAAEAIAAFEKKPAKRTAAATTKQPKPPSRSSRRESSAKRNATEPQPPAEPRPPVEMRDLNDVSASDLVAACLHPSAPAMSKDLAERLCAARPFRDADDAKRRVKGFAGKKVAKLLALGLEFIPRKVERKRQRRAEANDDHDGDGVQAEGDDEEEGQGAAAAAGEEAPKGRLRTRKKTNYREMDGPDDDEKEEEGKGKKRKRKQDDDDSSASEGESEDGDNDIDSDELEEEGGASPRSASESFSESDDEMFGGGPRKKKSKAKQRRAQSAYVGDLADNLPAEGDAWTAARERLVAIGASAHPAWRPRASELKKASRGSVSGSAGWSRLESSSHKVRHAAAPKGKPPKKGKRKGKGGGASAASAEGGGSQVAEAKAVELFGSRQLAEGGAAHWVCYAGGPIWALDWCVGAAEAAESCQVVALSAHAKDDKSHFLNEPSSGTNLIQIWQMPTSHDAPAEADADAAQQPRMLFAIEHNGGLAWDLKWLPYASDADGAPPPPSAGAAASGEAALPRLGLLAAALGSGEIVVYAVPHLSAVSAASKQKGAAVLALEPVFRATMEGKLMWTLAWSPSGDRIAAGCADGWLTVWGLDSSGAEAAAQRPPLVSVKAHKEAVRQCAWAPALDDSWGPGGAQTVATVSHDSCLSLWDLRDVWEPNLTAMSTKTTWATSCVWPLDTASVWSCYTDGRLKLASLGHGNIRHRIPFETPNPNQALWNMAVSPAHPELCAACGDGGTVVVASNLRDVAHDLADKSNHRLRVGIPIKLTYDKGEQTLVVDTTLTSEAKFQDAKTIAGGRHRIGAGSGTMKPKSPGAKKESRPTFIQAAREAQQSEGGASAAASEDEGLAFPKLTGLRRIVFGGGEENWRWLAFGGASGLLHCARIGMDESQTRV